MRKVVGRIRARVPGVCVVGAALTSALGSSGPAHGFAEQAPGAQRLHPDVRPVRRRHRLRSGDPRSETGGLHAELVPDRTAGGSGDRLHPNRAGYRAMRQAIDLGPAPSAIHRDFKLRSQFAHAKRECARAVVSGARPSETHINRHPPRCNNRDGGRSTHWVHTDQNQPALASEVDRRLPATKASSYELRSYGDSALNCLSTKLLIRAIKCTVTVIP